MSNRALIYCRQTKRWLLSRSDDNYWDLPEQAEGKYLGIIYPDKIRVSWQTLPRENAVVNGNYAWQSNPQNLQHGKYLAILAPQLSTFAQNLEPREISKWQPPAESTPLFYSECRKYADAFNVTEAWYKGMRVAHAMVKINNGMLYDVVVHPEWRGRGIASTLMHHLLSSGYPPKQLFARPNMKDTGLALANLIKFYERFQFKMVDSDKNLMVRSVEESLAAKFTLKQSPKPLKLEEKSVSHHDAAIIINDFKSIIERFTKKWEAAGSYRRGAAEVGDIDFIVIDVNLGQLVQALDKKFPIIDTWRQGDKIASFYINYDNRKIQIEFVNVPAASFGAALLHSTGSSQFNIGIRKYATIKGFDKLNQYGLFKGGKQVAGNTEQSIFNALGLKVIPPNERDNFWQRKDSYKLNKSSISLSRFALAAKFRKPRIMYHGTSNKFLRSIMTNGIQANPKSRTWEKDPDAGFYNPTRAGLSGSYWASNLMTARSAAFNTIKKFGGKEIIVIAQINEQSAFADEDDLRHTVEWPFSDAIKHVFPNVESDSYVFLFENFYVGRDAKAIREKALNYFIEDMHNKLSNNPSIPLDREKMAKLFDDFLMRPIAYEAKKIGQGKRLEIIARDAGITIPTPQEAENNYLRDLEWLTVRYRGSAFFSKDPLNHTLRTLYPIGFRGNNKIIGIIQDNAIEDGRMERFIPGSHRLTLLYGQIPRQFIQDYEKHIGKWPGIEKASK